MAMLPLPIVEAVKPRFTVKQIHYLRFLRWRYLNRHVSEWPFIEVQR